MTEQKKLTRREAIKLLGTATGAVTLANLPAKWTSPELSGGSIPAHAQTSCITLTVYVETAGSITATGIGTISSITGNVPTGQTNVFPCQGGCYGYQVQSNDATDVHAIFTVNGSVVFDQIFNNSAHYIIVDGTENAYAVDNEPSATTSCSSSIF